MADVPISAEGLLALTWGLNFLIFVFLVARLWLHRAEQLKGAAIKWSDGLIVASFVFGIGTIATDAWKYAMEIQHRHREATLMEMQTGPKLSYFCGYLVFTAMWLAKASLVAYYYHVFRALSNWLRYMLHGIAVFTVATYVVTILLQALYCKPFSANWSLDPDISCWATGNLYTLPVVTACTAASDLVIAIFPLLVIHTLSMSRKDTAALIIVFLVGGLSLFAAFARFVAIYTVISKNPKASIVHTYELWALVEITAGQLAVCLPALRAMYRRRENRIQWKRWSGQTKLLSPSAPLSSWMGQSEKTENGGSGSEHEEHEKEPAAGDSV